MATPDFNKVSMEWLAQRYSAQTTFGTSCMINREVNLVLLFVLCFRKKNLHLFSSYIQLNLSVTKLVYIAKDIIILFKGTWPNLDFLHFNLSMFLA